jgi:hypothetical protein
VCISWLLHCNAWRTPRRVLTSAIYIREVHSKNPFHRKILYFAISHTFLQYFLTESRLVHINSSYSTQCSTKCGIKLHKIAIFIVVVSKEEVTSSYPKYSEGIIFIVAPCILNITDKYNDIFPILMYNFSKEQYVLPEDDLRIETCRSILSVLM